jgi:probable FeS assembly SUF system protein SufT
MHEEVALTRDCTAVVVPWGTPVTLRRGDLAHITQQLGGNFTVVVDGAMYRIDGRDADALGKEVPEALAISSEEEVSLEEVEAAAWGQLATCYDPEIPINIVELGLIYDLRVTPEDQGYRVAVEMTLTAPGCGMGHFLAQEVRDKLLAIPGVSEADVRLVWDPPWDRSMMSEAAKLEAGLY